MRALQLNLLGQFECSTGDDERISLPMRKAEVLLAYLALAPGLRHPRERLINLLWSDRAEEQARNSLRQCLSAIKKSLGEAADLVLQVDRTTVCLSPELIEVDVHEFERLGAAGDYESLTTAADLYQGEFLEGISIRDPASQEWLDNERGRLKRQFIEILSNLAETQLISHDFGYAIRSAERLVKQDPLNESVWRLLMRSYHESGDRNHALQAFKRCQHILRDELDVEPEAATRELRDQIAGGETDPPRQPAPIVKQATNSAPPSTDHSIAVLPFDNLSGDPEQEYFSDGITDSIILNLSLFPGLNVKSRNSSFAFKQQIKSLGEISQELGVDYIVEGSIRKSADRIRITVQLIEADSGNQVWGKRYDAEINDLFELEEELSRSIAATVTGQIESDLQRIALEKGATDQRAYDLLLSGTYHMHRFTGPDMKIAIGQFERCLEKDPDNVRAHAALYFCHAMNWMERWIEDFEPAFELAGKHALKALELDPEPALVQVANGEYRIFRHEYDKAAEHLETALARNPNDTDALSTKAMNLSSRGQFEAALEVASLAYQLDPYHPWADWILAESQFFCGRYEDALETIAASKNAPTFIRIYNVAANVQLGRIDKARRALQVYLEECRNEMQAMPQTLEEWLRYTRDNAPFADSSVNDYILDCLCKAGLDTELQSQAAKASDGDLPSILVMPFSNLSGDPEQEYFSDGITESIILNLSSFNGLNVKSRHASFAFKHTTKSIDDIAAELGVQYIVEGSIRILGNKVRINVQLDDTGSGNQIWGKRFDYDLADLFKLEEELSLTIAGTVSTRIDKEARLISLRKPAKDLQSYDYYMRGSYQLEMFTASDIYFAIEQLEKCLALDPDNSRAHAKLGIAHMLALYENCTLDRKRSTELMDKHMKRALELDPDDAEAHAFMAERLMYIREFDRALVHARKAVELNPTMADGYSMLAWHAGATGEIDKALEYAEKSMQTDIHHPYAGWNAGEIYRLNGDYEKAIETFRSMAHISSSVYAQIAACLAGLNRTDEARLEMRRFLELAREQMTTMPASREEWFSFWWETMPYKHGEDSHKFFELLLQAGLCDSLKESTDNDPSIAVLPFENMSGDPEQEHFADGITTDIIATLSKFPHLRNVSRYSTLQYKTEKPSIAEIVEQQNVRYVLEGSVRKSGERIRVNAELIDSNNDEVCWSERYDRELHDLFEVQDEITRHIALAMKMQLDDGEMVLHRSKGATSIRAWELTLAAVDLQETYIRQKILEARAMVNEAIELDPGYAYAWITLGWTYWQEAYSGWTDAIDDLIDEAEKANRYAMSLEPDYGEAWSQAGMNHRMKHEADEAIAACLKAVELEPGSAEVHALTAWAYLDMNDFEAARKHEQNMRKLCPILPNWYHLVSGGIEERCGNLDLAIEHFQQGLEVEPDSPLCRFYLIDALMEKGDEARAAKFADEIRALDKSVTGKGLVHANSCDAKERQRFYDNLAKFDLV